MMGWLVRSVMHVISPRVCVVGIIRKGNKILLTRRAKLLVEGGKWCLPGGHVDKGETGENAVRREILEETGLRTTRARFLFYHDEFVRRLAVHAVILVFAVEVHGRAKANWEVGDMKWFEKKEIEKLDMAFTHKDILIRYFGGRK